MWHQNDAFSMICNNYVKCGKINTIKTLSSYLMTILHFRNMTNKILNQNHHSYFVLFYIKILLQILAKTVTSEHNKQSVYKNIRICLYIYVKQAKFNGDAIIVGQAMTTKYNKNVMVISLEEIVLLVIIRD